MKKLSKERKVHLENIINRVQRKSVRAASVRKQRKQVRKRYDRIRDLYRLNQVKKIEKNKFIHKCFDYTGNDLRIQINGELGIEERKSIDNFLLISSEIIEFNSKSLFIDIEKCTRLWPSAITLLCSLFHWAEFANKYHYTKPPRIYSNNPIDKDVDLYLQHCGFYDYVGTRYEASETSKTKNVFSDKEVIKIRHEKNQHNLEKREADILQLLTDYSALSKEQIEEFDSIILTEAFNNVSEHGITGGDKGWWLLAQRHPKHKIISLNIADNGIGIRNTLMIGPQRNQINKKFEDIPDNDGEFIKLALFENVSGAYNAPIKEGVLIKSHERGSRRGNGLERIRNTCDRLELEFSILSHYGYVIRDNKGVVIKEGSMKKRVFAGTLYHFNIPARG